MCSNSPFTAEPSSDMADKVDGLITVLEIKATLFPFLIALEISLSTAAQDDFFPAFKGFLILSLS